METKSFINSFLFSLHEGNEKTVENNTKNIKEVNEQLKCEEGAYKNWPYPKSFRFLLPETSSAKNLKIPTINNKKVQSLENASHNKYAQDRRYHYHNGRKSDDADKKRYLPRLFHSWLSTTKNEKPLFNPSFDIQTCLPKKHESQKNTKDEILKGFKPLGTSILRPRQSSAPQERITIVDEAVQKSQISIKTTYSNFDMMKGPRNFPRKEKDVKLLQSKRKSLRHSETPPPRPRPPVYPPNATPGDVDNNTNYTFHPSPHRSPPSIGRPSFSRAQESKERDPYQRLKTTKEIREIAVLSSGELIKKETVGVETIPIRKPNAAFNSEATTSKHVKIDEHEDVRVRNIRPVQMSPGTVEYLPLDAAKLEAQSENLLEKLRKNRKP